MAVRLLIPQPHAVHPRLPTIALDPDALRRFFRDVADVGVRQLEYVPYARFMLAEALEEASGGGLGETVRAILRDRATGGFLAGVGETTRSPQDYVKFGTAIGHLIGAANHDAMSGTYYARFEVKHTDDSDSFLRQAYRPLTLHTDGTYVEERTDWLLMMKFVERNARGGESRLVHLDDWSERDRFATDPIGLAPMPYKAPPSKNVPQPVFRPTFSRTPEGWKISFIDQFANPQTLAQGRYLAALSRSLESSPATFALPLPPGELVVLNNAFWMHGRAAFEPDVALHRELMRLRGVFAPA